MIYLQLWKLPSSLLMATMLSQLNTSAKTTCHPVTSLATNSSLDLLHLGFHNFEKTDTYFPVSFTFYWVKHHNQCTCHKTIPKIKNLYNNHLVEHFLQTWEKGSIRSPFSDVKYILVWFKGICNLNSDTRISSKM